MPCGGEAPDFPAHDLNLLICDLKQCSAARVCKSNANAYLGSDVGFGAKSTLQICVTTKEQYAVGRQTGLCLRHWILYLESDLMAQRCVTVEHFASIYFEAIAQDK